MNTHNPREALIHAAIAILGEARPPAMPLREVAQTAGVTTGAIQHYFGNRHGLLVAAIDRQTESLIGRLSRVEREYPKGDPRRLTMILQQLLPLDEERTREFRLLNAFERNASENSVLTAEFRKRYGRLLDRVGEELPRGATDAALVLSVTYGTGADLLLGVTTVESALAGIDRVIELLAADQPR